MKLGVDEPEGPLQLADFDRLQAVLAHDSLRCMNVEMLDAYSAGLECAPARASIGLCFAPVFGVEIIADADFVDTAEAAGTEWLLRRHWTMVSATLEAALAEPALCATKHCCSRMMRAGSQRMTGRGDSQSRCAPNRRRGERSSRSPPACSNPYTA